ncbi:MULTISPECIES: S41 family peptidase [Marinobacter]|jgi:carboxyl-terminal processing protease|uniref:Carboxyl-terminal protease n=1 Tax=Marinobacter nauticus TaxID=2743 RepID=A0A833JL81_MARNT|nr:MULTISPECIES: S41 family peptidase [Marinobacter]MEC8898853.1 S41 family peptidase [Pseudomonadota bacterium]KAE8543897.1 Carboxyl-terminal protease [Marinobacter nauticus]MAC22105.1 peptidase S41 [Marinobacter sp.]MAH30643.1 peptidase S41 [Marinobacter sp.]MBU41269.1 peptidase S41 [Marinobacter sp.]|tara:strand:- start:2918 stop:4324 length:1407 start_codon:yes stop_codon:yes gene_type:complete
MKRARSTLKTSPLRTMILATCCFTAPGLALAQDQDAQTQQILDSIQSGERVELKLPDPEEQLPLEDLRKFTEVFSRIKDAYVEDVSDTQLLESAIKGMLSDLDPHSTYLAPKDYEELEESTSGEFGGLGIEVGMENGFVKVISPIDDTPAQKAGVQAGDLIIKLDEKPVKGMSLEEAVNLMRGKPGTVLTLTIMREGESAPIEIDVTRDVIKVTSVKSRMIDNGYGYVRVTQFQAETGRQFLKALSDLEDEHGNDLDGLIIDLRNNPGGVLQAAVETADALLDEGLIVYTEGRIQSSRLRFSAKPGDVMAGTPIVVLINGGSASASEILAGALQDHERAVVMGTQSFGKGSVQTVIPLDETHAIKMTTARYFTPDGRSIQATGIKPDIEVRPAELKELDSRPFFTEADLSGHLEGENEEEARKAREQAAEAQASAADRDYQLRSALNLLKGLHILNRKNNSKPQENAQ